ncbi:MAG: hypothetical protein DLM61_20525, partial [Pseudonocardiales bacterium]
ISSRSDNINVTRTAGILSNRTTKIKCYDRLSPSSPGPLELLSHPDRSHPNTPVAACRAKCGRISSSLPPTSSLPDFTHGMSLASAKDATARRNRCPIWLNNAGDGNG